MHLVVKIVAIMFLFLGTLETITAQPKIQLEFRKNKTFKIAQFTDLHLDLKSSGFSVTTETIKNVLETEKPDLAILTGDVVVAVPALEGWKELAKVFAASKLPWAVTLGNHDGEPQVTRDEIFELLVSLPYFVGSKGPELTGCGNYDLPVKSSHTRKVAAVIYCFDSNDYCKDEKFGRYDCIHDDQIGWYTKTSEHYQKGNNRTPVPSLAFFHIPLIEYKNLVAEGKVIGESRETVSSSEINSGLFTAFVNKKDIMGLFVGHDHNDNYVGIWKNIVLGFGEVTGADGYGELERGSRIILLHEGQFSFDTWVRTKSGTKFQFNYQAGVVGI